MARWKEKQRKNTPPLPPPPHPRLAEIMGVKFISREEASSSCRSLASKSGRLEGDYQRAHRQTDVCEKEEDAAKVAESDKIVSADNASV